MPYACFSYRADVRADAQPSLRDPRRMPHSCFSYPVVSWCFSHNPVSVPRSMPVTCHSYSLDAPQRALPGLRRMPGTCFRY